MPELVDKNERKNYIPVLCKEIKMEKQSGIKVNNDLDIEYRSLFGKDVFYLLQNDILVGILETVKLKLKNYPFEVFQEESIDICSEYRAKGFGTTFYYNLIKNGFRILSDFKHYKGTKGLWVKLSKQKDVIIKIVKNDEIVNENYDLDTDEMGVWKSNQLLILATTSKIEERLEFYASILK